MARSSTVRAAADSPICRSTRGTVSRRQNASHRAARPSAVSPRHSGQSISCRTASSRAIIVAEPIQPEPRRPAPAPLRRARPSRSRSTSSVNSNSSVPAWAPSSTRNRGSSPASTAWARSSDAAERVDRADPRGVQLAHQRQPVVRPGPRGMLSKRSVAGLADAVAHFAGGPLGEGNGHQLAQAAAAAAAGRPAPVRPRNRSVKHERLAAARPRRQRHGDAAGRDRPLLLVGQTRRVHSGAVGWHVFSRERT